MIEQKVYAKILISRQWHLLFRHGLSVDARCEELRIIYNIARKENPGFPQYFLEHCENQGEENVDP